MIKKFANTINQFEYDSDWQLAFVAILTITILAIAVVVISLAFALNTYIGCIVLFTIIYCFMRFLYLKAKNDI